MSGVATTAGPKESLTACWVARMWAAGIVRNYFELGYQKQPWPCYIKLSHFEKRRYLRSYFWENFSGSSLFPFLETKMLFFGQKYILICDGMGLTIIKWKPMTRLPFWDFSSLVVSKEKGKIGAWYALDWLGRMGAALVWLPGQESTWGKQLKCCPPKACLLGAPSSTCQNKNM